jgi:hypothetical protein
VKNSSSDDANLRENINEIFKRGEKLLFWVIKNALIETVEIGGGGSLEARIRKRNCRSISKINLRVEK